MPGGDAGGWRRTHALLQLEAAGGRLLGQAVLALEAVAAGGEPVALSLAVRRQSQRVGTIDGCFSLA